METGHERRGDRPCGRGSLAAQNIIGAVAMSDSSVLSPERERSEAERKSARAPRAKGPRVWLDMDQQELAAAYDQSKYAATQPQIQERRAAASARARAALGEPL